MTAPVPLSGDEGPSSGGAVAWHVEGYGTTDSEVMRDEALGRGFTVTPLYAHPHPVQDAEGMRVDMRLAAQSAVVEWLAGYQQEYRAPHDRLCDLIADAILSALPAVGGGNE
jgi:hypothetical protein